MSSPLTIVDVWDDPERRWPSIAYIETTNRCNARCLPCLNDRCLRERGTMSPTRFKMIADKLKAHGVKIGAMFCFGEPLLDTTLFEKFRYAKSIDMLTDHVGMNTNVSRLVPEMFDAILEHVPNIILSFFNTDAEFERITGLDWEDCYSKARAFLDYRAKHKPDYPVYIGCNTVKDHSLENVKEAFKGYDVKYVQDAELRWGGSVITGVVDRVIMHNSWRCDGHKGALQIKWNGDCEFCAYDIIGSPEGGETKFGNIITDEWATLEEAFRKKWREPSTLCRRCDYFHKFKAVKCFGFKRPEPLPDDWFDWQKPFLREGEGIAA